MSYTGYTVQLLHVHLDGKSIGSFRVGDKPSVVQYTKWWSGQENYIPAKMDKNGNVKQAEQHIRGALNDEDRLAMLDQQGIDVSEIPEGTDLQKTITFVPHDVRYDTFEAFINNRTTALLNKRKKEFQEKVNAFKSQGLTPEVTKWLETLNPQERVMFLKTAAGL